MGDRMSSNDPPGEYWDLRKTIPQVMEPETVFESELSESIKEACNAGIIRDRRFPNPHTRFTVSPSELSECIRKTILMRHYEVPELTASQAKGYAEMQRMADMGNCLHDGAIVALQTQGVAITGELREEDGAIPSTMRLDGFYEAVDADDVTYVLEIKTMGTQQYAEAIQNLMPRPQDLLQLQYYMDVKNVELGLLMIIDRGYGSMEVMTVNYDPGIVNYVYERFSTITLADQSHQVVGRVFRPNYWKCSLKACLMKDICKALGPDPCVMECMPLEGSGR